eukprot:1162028-Pelagomonas_calceolata.AAC.7
MVQWSVQSWQRAHTRSTDERAEVHKPVKVPPHGTPSALSELPVNERPHGHQPTRASRAVRIRYPV